MHVRVAGFTIQVTCNLQDLADLNVALSSAYAPFLVEAAPPDVAIDVVARNLADARDDGTHECVFDSGGAWRLYRHDEGVLFRCYSSNLESCPYKTARFNHDFSRGTIALHQPFFAGTGPADPLEYPLDELLVISLLGQERGLEIHGCGVVDGSTGYLFVGQSGAGKSTMARLWLAERDAVILSDDRVVLRGDEDGLWMYGTPWHGEEPLASPRRARLAGVFFLQQRAQNTIAPVARVDAVARLFAASFPPFHHAAALDFTLRFLDGVVGGVPCVELGFTPAPSVLDLIRRHG